MKMSNSKKVYSNVLQQNCFVRQIAPLFDKKSKFIDSDFWQLDREVTPDGYREKLVKYPHKVTPDSVNSYADSTNYRIDTENFVLGSGRNYQSADVRAIQDIASMDSEQARVYLDELQSRINAALEKIKKSPSNDDGNGGNE